MVDNAGYALEQALKSKNRDFPLIGLLHGVHVSEIPAPLRVRLCVDLADASWREAILAAIENRAPRLQIGETSTYLWATHRPYLSMPDTTAIEIRPRFGEVHYWRAAVPFGTKLVAWGSGPAGGSALSAMQTMVVEGGDGQVNGRRFAWFGAGDRLTPSTSAYLVFPGDPPDLVGFGKANESAGPPDPMEFRQFPSTK